MAKKGASAHRAPACIFGISWTVRACQRMVGGREPVLAPFPYVAAAKPASGFPRTSIRSPIVEIWHAAEAPRRRASRGAVAQYEAGGFLAYHDGGGVGVGRDDPGHDRGIDHAKVLDSPQPKVRVDH